MGKHFYMAFIMLVMGVLSSTAQQLNLFSEDMRVSANPRQTIVMDFVERYFSQLLSMKQSAIPSKMADDKVYFRKGKPMDLRLVSADMLVSISLVDRHYELMWEKGNQPFLNIVFPAQFDLIFGLRQDEAQQRLKDDIVNAPHFVTSHPTPVGMKEKEKGIFVSQQSHFELESLNNAKYYKKSGDDFIPVFDSSFKEYSAANLFQGLVPVDSFQIYVNQTVYGMETKSFNITLEQWLDYCTYLGLDIYFAVEEEREDGLLALVLVHSREFGFNHMLSVVVPDHFVDHAPTILKARLTSYIPTHNLKDLYQKESKKRKRIQWQ